jgi:hypothetical protein
LIEGGVGEALAAEALVESLNELFSLERAVAGASEAMAK